jgi:hypothetical protein
MPGLRQDAWTLADPGSNRYNMEHRESDWLNVLGRLRPGVSRQSATQDLETLMRQLVAAYPDAHPGVNTITLDPLWRSPFGANAYLAASLPILLAIASVVLLLTCAMSPRLPSCASFLAGARRQFGSRWEQAACS